MDVVVWLDGDLSDIENFAGVGDRFVAKCVRVNGIGAIDQAPIDR